MTKTYDKIEELKNKEIKKNNWEVAIGLNKVDGLTPSPYLKELINESINGKSSYKEIEEKLSKYYKNSDLKNIEIKKNRECDIVSTRIAELLEDGSFTFSPIYLKSIHKYLFDGVFEGDIKDYAGIFRDYNISKKEDILNGKTVIYGNHKDLLEYLRYDFGEEENINYTKLSPEKQVERISKFTSAIWQVHPFVEGNTRTTAVFIEKYLRTKGYEVNNDLFKENSLFFRNALVISNFSDITLGISPDFKYLRSFFSKLLLNKTQELIDLKEFKEKINFKENNNSWTKKLDNDKSNDFER